MTSLNSSYRAIQQFADKVLVCEVHLVAAAFLALYSGRTLEAYRHDLRTFFQWAEDVALPVLEASRPPH